MTVGHSKIPGFLSVLPPNTFPAVGKGSHDSPEDWGHLLSHRAGRDTRQSLSTEGPNPTQGVRFKLLSVLEGYGAIKCY